MSIAGSMWMEGIIAEERARLERYNKAWEAYWGETPDTVKSKPGQPDDNVKVNYARLIVDKNTAALFGREPLFELPDGAPAGAADWLAGFWRRNRKMQLLQKVAVNGSVCGHAFIKIVPPSPGEKYPRLINLSPEYVNVITDPDDIETVHRYVIQYPARGVDGERLVVRQVIERNGTGWTVTDEVSVNGGNWQERQAAPWRWSWSPIVDCQNLPSPNEYYGIADLEKDVLDLNRSINFTLSNLQRIIRYHAHPKTWGSGFSAKELKIAVDETIVLANSDARLQNLEMQSDLSSSIDFYRRIKEALHEVAGIPEVAIGKLESTGVLSGVALEILYQPLTDRTEARRLTYGEMLVELNRRALDMGGYGAEIYTAIHWPDLLPKDAMEERQAAKIDVELGADQDTVLSRLGYEQNE